MNTVRCGIEIDEMTAMKLDDQDVAFSLTCRGMHYRGCDAGDGVDSFERAVILGWTEIEFDDGFSWNFLGVCPECKER